MAGRNAQGRSSAWQRGRGHYVAVKMNTQKALFPMSPEVHKPDWQGVVSGPGSEQYLRLALDHASAEQRKARFDNTR